MTVYSAGIPLKKQFGQHFLRQQSVVDAMIAKVNLINTSSVFEIGCGDGFLTQSILKEPLARLWIFEIDAHWADYVKKTFPDERLSMFQENILDVDFTRFQEHKPWILLANLPYLITFPILHLLQRNRDLLQEGVIMIQEEVAQKLVKSSGKGYGYPSLFFQHYFELQLLQKIAPGAFFPPPKVHSRLVYFKPRPDPIAIPDEENFWKFIKICFRQPRRTLRNNLIQTQIDCAKVPEKYLLLRAQQMKMTDFLHIWELIK